MSLGKGKAEVLCVPNARKDQEIRAIRYRSLLQSVKLPYTIPRRMHIEYFIVSLFRKGVE